MNYRGYFNFRVVDKEKEEVMKYRRIVYDYDDWRWYCSSIWYVWYLLLMMFLRVVMVIWFLVFILIFVVVIIIGYNEVVMVKVLLLWMLLLYLLIFLLFFMVFCFLFLFVFCINFFYIRFDEVWKVWGIIVNRMRDMVW